MAQSPVRLHLLPALVALALLAGCADAPSKKVKDDLDLRLHDLGSSVFPANRTRAAGYSVHLLDTKAEFEAAWRSHYNTTKPPTIDFGARHAVVVELLGVASDGWTLEVTNLTFEDGLYRAAIVASEPGAGCAVTRVRSDVVTFATFDAKLPTADDSRLAASKVNRVRAC